MLSAYSLDNGAVLAMEAHKDDGPFHCPQCEEEVILKQGRVKIAHFAHFPDADCSYASEPESAEHLSVKLEIYEALKAEPGVSKLQVERYLKEVRPDISFCYENRYIAIEVQISPLRFDELIRRTTIYAQKISTSCGRPSCQWMSSQDATHRRRGNERSTSCMRASSTTG